MTAPAERPSRAPADSPDCNGFGTQERCLIRLPKADLHVHLEGAMRPETLVDLARRRGEPPPPVGRYRSFGAFQDSYRRVVALIRSKADLRRLVREVVEDAAASGAVWIEPHFNPTTYTPALGHPEDVLDLVLEASRAAGEQLGVGFGLTLSASRNRDPRQAIDLAHLAAAYADLGVVAFGLAGDETLSSPEAFATAFAIARNAGLLSTPHAGELVGGPSLHRTLDALLPDRIAHGIRAVEDPALLARLADQQVALDVSLTSNRVLAAVSHIEEHPLRRLLSAGVRCTLGTDDPLLLETDLVAEYQLARGRLALSDAQLASLAQNSIQMSGAPRTDVRRALHDIEHWLSVV